MQSISLNLLTTNPKNGQTHSNNSLATADELFVFDHFMWLALKGLTTYLIHFLLCINKMTYIIGERFPRASKIFINHQKFSGSLTDSMFSRNIVMKLYSWNNFHPQSH